MDADADATEEGEAEDALPPSPLLVLSLDSDVADAADHV
jgi:hypothetical protein